MARKQTFICAMYQKNKKKKHNQAWLYCTDKAENIPHINTQY